MFRFIDKKYLLSIFHKKNIIIYILYQVIYKVTKIYKEYFTVFVNIYQYPPDNNAPLSLLLISKTLCNIYLEIIYLKRKKIFFFTIFRFKFFTEIKKMRRV